MANELVSVTVADGKYTIREKAPYKWECLRYGEHWPAFDNIGPDNLHIALAHEVESLRKDQNTRRGAAVEGLETVGFVCKEAIEYHRRGYGVFIRAEPEGDDNEPVVTRSQAEAIIAAKDERLKDCRSVINEFKREIEKHEANNAALNARVEELENKLAGFCEGI